MNWLYQSFDISEGFPDSFRITEVAGEPKTDSKTHDFLRFSANTSEQPVPFDRAIEPI
jgi:hypothetical protein